MAEADLRLRTVSGVQVVHRGICGEMYRAGHLALGQASSEMIRSSAVAFDNETYLRPGPFIVLRRNVFQRETVARNGG